MKLTLRIRDSILYTFFIKINELNRTLKYKIHISLKPGKKLDCINNRYTFSYARSRVYQLSCKRNYYIFIKKMYGNLNKTQFFMEHFNHVLQSVSWKEKKRKRLSDLYRSERLVARSLVMNLVFCFEITRLAFFVLFAIKVDVLMIDNEIG